MTFARPEYVALAPAVVLLVTTAVVAQWRRSVRLADAYGGPDAARRLTGRRLTRFPAVRLFALSVASLCLVAAAAGVQRDEPEPPPPPIPIDLIVAVDVSQSMAGADVAPSRIARARDLVERILDEKVVDRVALSLFADWPYNLVPLTHDADVVSFFSPYMAPDLVTLRDQGSTLEAIVSQAADTWHEREREGATPVLLLVTDGEVHGRGPALLDTVAAVSGQGLRVWTAGIGSSDGAPLFVPGSDGAPLLDDGGRPVIAAYDPDLLRDVAERGGGVFHDVSEDGGIDDLIDDLADIRGTVETPTVASIDPTVPLVAAAMLLLILDALLDAGVLVRTARPPGRSRGR